MQVQIGNERKKTVNDNKYHFLVCACYCCFMLQIIDIPISLSIFTYFTLVIKKMIIIDIDEGKSGRAA